MKFFYFGGLVILIISSISSYGQYRSIDSLRTVVLQKRITPSDKCETLLRLGDAYKSIHSDSAEFFYKQSLGIAERTNGKQYTLEAWEKLGILYRDILPRRKDASIEAFATAISYAKELEDLDKEAILYSSLADLFWFEQEYVLMTENALQALRIFRKNNNHAKQAEALTLLLLGCLQTSDFENGFRYADEALQILTLLNDYNNVGTTYLNIASLHYRGQQYDSAIINYAKALSILEKNNGPSATIGSALSGLGISYFKKGEFAKARLYFARMLEINSKVNNYWGVMIALSNLGKTALAEKDYTGSVARYKEALETFKHHDVKFSPEETLQNIYKGLSTAYYFLKEYEKAYEALSRYHEYKQKLHEKIKADQFKSLQTKFEKEKKEQELALMSGENRVLRLKIFFFIGVWIAVAVLANIFFLMYRRRKLLKSLELSRSNNAIVQTLFEQEKRQTALQKELEFKKRELTSYSLHLIQKNEMLDLLKTEIEQLKNTKKDGTGKKLSAILEKKEFSHRAEDDWKNFRDHFDQVHAGFIDRLSLDYPELNENDLRLCALLKLNFDTKQIASLLDITPDSAKVARYRLRRKLKLDTDVNISAFLNTIDPK